MNRLSVSTSPMGRLELHFPGAEPDDEYWSFCSMNGRVAIPSRAYKTSIESVYIWLPPGVLTSAGFVATRDVSIRISRSRAGLGPMPSFRTASTAWCRHPHPCSRQARCTA